MIRSRDQIEPSIRVFRPSTQDRRRSRITVEYVGLKGRSGITPLSHRNARQAESLRYRHAGELPSSQPTPQQHVRGRENVAVELLRQDRSRTILDWPLGSHEHRSLFHELVRCGLYVLSQGPSDRLRIVAFLLRMKGIFLSMAFDCARSPLGECASGEI
jgi:hypothetical protein